MLQRYGEFVVRRARLLLVISGVVLIAAAVFGAGAFGKLKNGGFNDPNTASSRAQQMINDQYGGQTNLVTSTNGDAVVGPMEGVTQPVVGALARSARMSTQRSGPIHLTYSAALVVCPARPRRTGSSRDLGERSKQILADAERTDTRENP